MVADTSELDSPNFNACIKHQDAEVYGEYGQRGCEACIFTANLVKKAVDTEIAKARKQWLTDLTIWANNEMANDWVEAQLKPKEG